MKNRETYKTVKEERAPISEGIGPLRLFSGRYLWGNECCLLKRSRNNTINIGNP